MPCRTRPGCTTAVRTTEDDGPHPAPCRGRRILPRRPSRRDPLDAVINSRPADSFGPVSRYPVRVAARSRRPRLTSPIVSRHCGTCPRMPSRVRRRRWRTGPIWERQLAHCAQREQVLASQRTGRVGQVIAGAHRPHPLSDLRVAITGQVGVEVVFDLVAQVSAQERHHRSGVEVRRTQHLSQIPLGLRLTLQRGRREFLRAVREVPTADHHVRPDIAQQVGGHVCFQRAAPPPPAEGGKEQIVLGGLATNLADQCSGAGGFLGAGRRTFMVGVQVVQGDAPLERDRQQHVSQWR